VPFSDLFGRANTLAQIVAAAHRASIFQREKVMPVGLRSSLVVVATISVRDRTYRFNFIFMRKAA